MRDRPTCDLCGDVLNYSRGVHTYQADTHELDIHPECAMQLFNGTWDTMTDLYARGELSLEPLPEPRQEDIAAPVQKSAPTEPLEWAIDVDGLIEDVQSRLIHKAASPLVKKSGIGGACGKGFESYYHAVYPDGKELCMHPEVAEEKGLIINGN